MGMKKSIGIVCVVVGVLFLGNFAYAATAGQVNTTKEKTMVKAKARHILVDSEDTCKELKSQIEGGADFGEVAKKHSKCPSGKQGGDLGEFGPGRMVPEFDTVVFSAEVGKVQGPVKTDFGYHLIEVTSRTDE